MMSEAKYEYYMNRARDAEERARGAADDGMRQSWERVALSWLSLAEHAAKTGSPRWSEAT